MRSFHLFNKNICISQNKRMAFLPSDPTGIWYPSISLNSKWRMIMTVINSHYLKIWIEWITLRARLPHSVQSPYILWKHGMRLVCHFGGVFYVFFHNLNVLFVFHGDIPENVVFLSRKWSNPFNSCTALGINIPKTMAPRILTPLFPIHESIHFVICFSS